MTDTPASTPSEPAEFFVLDPRHAPFIAGESSDLNDLRLTWFRRFTLLALVLAAAILVVTTLFDLGGGEKRYQVEATVLDRQQVGTELTPRYEISYTYTDHRGETYTVENRRVEYNVYLRARPGLPLTVEYEEGRNQRAEPADISSYYAGQALRLLLVVVLIVLILWVGFFWIVRPGRVNARLEQEGQFVRGRVQKAWPSVIARQYVVHIAYRFTPPDHDEIMAELSLSRKDLRNISLPLPNQTVLVRYINSKLYRLM